MMPRKLRSTDKAEQWVACARIIDSGINCCSSIAKEMNCDLADVYNYVRALKYREILDGSSGRRHQEARYWLTVPVELVERMIYGTNDETERCLKEIEAAIRNWRIERFDTETNEYVEVAK